MARPRIRATTEVGRQIERQMDAQELTMGETAKALHTSDQTLRDWFRGQEPTFLAVRRIARFCGVTPATVSDWILSDLPDEDLPNPGQVKKERVRRNRPKFQGFSPIPTVA